MYYLTISHISIFVHFRHLLARGVAEHFPRSIVHNQRVIQPTLGSWPLSAPTDLHFVGRNLHAGRGQYLQSHKPHALFLYSPCVLVVSSGVHCFHRMAQNDRTIFIALQRVNGNTENAILLVYIFPIIPLPWGYKQTNSILGSGNDSDNYLLQPHFVRERVFDKKIV